MSLDSYTNLKTEISNWIERSDLSSKIDTFIDLFEARANRELRIRSMVKRARSTVSTSTRYVALPSDYRAMRAIRLIDDPVKVLTYCSADELARQWKSGAAAPTFYTIHEEVEFDSIPDDTYQLEMIYYASFTALSDANTSNSLLVLAPDLYLWGSLVCAEPYLDNDERMPMWKSLADEALESVKREDKAARHGSGPLISKARGDRP